MQNIEKLFEKLQIEGTHIEFCEYNRSYKIADIQTFLQFNQNKDLYFLGGVTDQLSPPYRASDSNVLKKNYAVFDYDLIKYRKNTLREKDLTLEEWQEEIENLIKKIDNDPYFKDYFYIAFTGGGIHIAYLFEALDVKGGKEFWSDGYIQIADRLDKIMFPYKADRACRNLGRIFRIPGSYNQKYLPQVKVELVRIKDIIHSTLGRDILTLGEKSTSSKKSKSKKNLQKEKLTTNPQDLIALPFWDKMKRISSRYVLEKLSGSSFVNGQVYTFPKRDDRTVYIYVNDKAANAWIDEAGYIGGGSMTWIGWLQHPDLKKTRNEIQVWAEHNLKEFFNDKPSKAINNTRWHNLEPAINKHQSVLDLSKNQIQPFTWGVPSVDEVFPPLIPKRLITVVGNSGCGKSAYCFDLAIKNAQKGIKVLYLSLEMGSENLMLRYARDVVGITKEMVLKNNIPEEFHLEVEKVIQGLPSSLFIENPKDLIIKNQIFYTEIEDIIKKQEFELIIIDNLGFIDAAGESNQEKIEVIIRELSRLCNLYNTTIIALHHFNKNQDRSGNDKPRSIAAILGSAKIEHDSDFIVQLWRKIAHEDPATEEEKAKLAVIIMKDRDWGIWEYVTVFQYKGTFVRNFLNAKYRDETVDAKGSWGKAREK